MCRTVFGTFGQPNWLAAYLIMLIPWLLVASGFSKSRLAQGLAVGAALLWYSVLLFTKSRSGLLGLGFGVAIMIAWLGVSKLLFARQKNKDKSEQTGQSCNCSCGCCLPGGTITVIWHSRDAITTATAPACCHSTGWKCTASSWTRAWSRRYRIWKIRKIVWKRCPRCLEKYPLVGSGSRDVLPTATTRVDLHHIISSQIGFSVQQSSQWVAQYPHNHWLAPGLLPLLSWWPVHFSSALSG